MKYFILDKDPLYTSSPHILGGFEKIRIRDITLKRCGNIPAQTMLDIQGRADTVFTDVITNPFFMISEKMYKITKKYDKNIIGKQVVLMDSVNKKAELYYLLIMPHIDCVSEKSELNPSRTKFIRPVIDPLRVSKSRNIFWLKDFKSNLPVISLDLAESILRRDARGISLTLMELE